MHVGLGLNLGLGLGTGGSIRQDPADWPALKFWGRRTEVAGQPAFIDFSDSNGDGQPGTTDLVAGTGGTGTLWDVDGAMRTQAGATDYAYARTTGIANADLLNPGSKAIIMVADVVMIGGYTANVWGVGRSDNNVKGYCWHWADSGNGSLQMSLGGTGGNDRRFVWQGLTPSTVRNNRRVIMMAYGGADDPVGHLYIEGALVGSSPEASGDTIGSITIASGGANAPFAKLFFGLRGDAAPGTYNFSQALFYGAAIYHLNSLPANLTKAAQELTDFSRLPPSLKGLS